MQTATIEFLKERIIKHTHHLLWAPNDVIIRKLTNGWDLAEFHKIHSRKFVLILFMTIIHNTALITIASYIHSPNCTEHYCSNAYEFTYIFSGYIWSIWASAVMTVNHMDIPYVESMAIYHSDKQFIAFVKTQSATNIYLFTSFISCVILSSIRSIVNIIYITKDSGDIKYLFIYVIIYDVINVIYGFYIAGRFALAYSYEKPEVSPPPYVEIAIDTLPPPYTK